MITATQIRIGIQWLRTGNFFIWGWYSDYKQLAVESHVLKHLLFTWHADSFYGTFIESMELEKREGILLPASMALDYFADPTPNTHIDIEWNENIREIMKVAPEMKANLENGQLIPDFEKWKTGELGWKLPNTAESSLHFLDEWLDAILYEKLEHYRGLRQVWAQLKQSYPIVHRDELPHDLWRDEEDWLVSIGWKKDARPFQVCLKLSEPEDGNHWLISIMLQDRDNPDIMLECDAEGQPLSEAVPEPWLLHLPQIAEDIRKWTYLIPWLMRNEARTAIRTDIDSNEAWDFLTETSFRLIHFGYAVLLPPWWENVKQWKPKLRAKLRSSVGASQDTMFGLQQIVQFDWKLAVGDLELSEEEFRNLADQHQRLVQIRGRWVQLDPTTIAKIQQVMKQVNRKKGLNVRDVLELHLLGAPSDPDNAFDWEDDADVALQWEVELNDQFKQFLERLHHVTEIPLIDSPPALQGNLRKYQIQGSTWLLFLRQFGLGGCLADDMGLGKTIQWITYLLKLKDTENPDSPSLLICPTSVIGNWQKELERFAPSLRVHLHYGTGRKKGELFAASIENCDLVITSYTLAQMDEADLNTVHWNSICLDEAQNIKNAYTKQSSAIRRLKADHRIAMTGTPIENRLTELWSIYDFINPGYLGSLRTFNQQYVNRIEKTKDRKLIGQVKRLIQPFLLRRVKSDPAIELDLPDKLESKVFISLTTEQVALYENTLQDLFQKLEHASSMQRRGSILSTLIKLKQICNHPSLYAKETKLHPKKHASNKVERLLDMVRELRQEGDRCLIFTQFVEMGHLLQSILEKEFQEPVLFLHGGTPKAKRDEMIETFQKQNHQDEQECGIFILSLKAGGVGLNLTAANHVFHFDRWWNPAVETQATDRAFRIGQSKHVHVHKFITLGTLEERIDEMIERKQGLSQQIVGEGENWITELSTKELQELFALRKEWVNA